MPGFTPGRREESRGVGGNLVPRREGAGTSQVEFNRSRARLSSADFDGGDLD